MAARRNPYKKTVVVTCDYGHRQTKDWVAEDGCRPCAEFSEEQRIKALERAALEAIPTTPAPAVMRVRFRETGRTISFHATPRTRRR